MSHRRKSARPTNKLRRNPADTSSVSSDSDVDHSNKMIVEECVSRGRVGDPSPAPSSPSPQLALPPDLWLDFQALQAATHLDTTSLIRRLIRQYGRTGPQDDALQPPLADDNDNDTDATIICTDDLHITSTPNSDDHKFTGGGGGETPGCYGREMDVDTPDYPASGSALMGADDEDDCLVLDLSSGVRASGESVSTSGPVAEGRESGYGDGADRDVDSPLDLTVTKPTGLPFSREDGGEFMMSSKAPEAHRTPAVLLSALSHGALRTVSAATPPAQPREAHAATSGTTPSPRHVSSSLFNLSDFPLTAVQRGCGAVGQEDKAMTKAPGAGSGGGWSTDGHAKQKIVQHFLSLPAGHVIAPERQDVTDVHEKQMRGNASPADVLNHSALLTPSMHRLLNPLPSSSSSSTSLSGAPDTMQLPTVMSFDMQGMGSISKQPPMEQDAVATSQMAMSAHALPTSASAFLLDMGTGGLVATAGGSLAGVSTVNIMATGAGGLVAIPFLHALPEALAAAAQGHISHTPVSSQPTSQPPPPAQQPVPEVPPPPPYNAAVASVGPPAKKYKAKIGRPRGQPKPQKAQPKDMKLLTENTLFPGVYTSILKLPWSKRSRGKSSAKIKDVIETTTVAAAGSPYPEQHPTVTQREPGEVTDNIHHLQQQQQQQLHLQQTTPTTAVSEAVPLSLMSMPLLVPDQVPSSSSSTPSSTPSSAQSSVMMVYHNSTMSELGKPVRRRGRPPKLPVLSQLLAEQKTAQTEQQRQGHADTDPAARDFSLLPLAPLAPVDAFPATVVDPSSAVAFPTIVKQEPMEGGGRSVSQLFPAMPARERGEVASHRGTELQSGKQQLVKQDSAEVTGEETAESIGGGEGGTDTGKDGDKLQEASLETRFNILANQLGLEIGSPYHASLVYNQGTATPSSHSANTALYHQMMMSSRSLVEMKPRRRQLNSLIKPSDDCVYTSFRIRPRNSGRRGGKRGGKKRGAGSRYSPGKSLSLDIPSAEDYPGKDGYFRDKEGSGVCGAGGGLGSAVITERIPGAGEVPQRLYQDLYHCKMCNELLPADSSVPHTCSTPVSPPLRSCDACGTMYLSASSPLEGSSGQASLCEDCSHKVQLSSSPALSPSDPAHDDHHHHQGGTEGFACQPCGVHFVSIADYIQHRRSSHLEKMNRQSRKTHTLKTLPCPSRGCPRLFHMHAELSRHLRSDHPEEREEEEGQGKRGVEGEGEEVPDPGMEGVAAVPASGLMVDVTQDVDVETVPDNDGAAACAEEEQPQYTCYQNDCGRGFSTPLDLLEHVQSSHEGVSHWPCPLPGCTRHFGAERHLRVHLLMHKEEKPLKCPFCHYRCRQKNALQWHVRKHPEAAAGQYRRFAGVSADS